MGVEIDSSLKVLLKDVLIHRMAPDCSSVSMGIIVGNNHTSSMNVT